MQTDKSAATGSGEPKKIKHVVNGDQQGGWYCYACRFSSRDVTEAAAHDGTFTTPEQSEYATFTSPSSQPTVTLEGLQRWRFFHRGVLPEAMSPRDDGEWVKYEDVLALLRAAEQK